MVIGKKKSSLLIIIILDHGRVLVGVAGGGDGLVEEVLVALGQLVVGDVEAGLGLGEVDGHPELLGIGVS